MTAPDDLARILAEHAIANAPDDGTGYRPVACRCGWVQDGYGHRAHLARVLASVVSRRDADLQAEAWDEGANAVAANLMNGGRMVFVNPYRSRVPADTDTGRGQ